VRFKRQLRQLKALKQLKTVEDSYLEEPAILNHIRQTEVGDLDIVRGICAYVSIRQHTSAYVSIGYVSIHLHASYWTGRSRQS